MAGYIYIYIFPRLRQEGRVLKRKEASVEISPQGLKMFLKEMQVRLLPYIKSSFRCSGGVLDGSPDGRTDGATKNT